ncbi:MAG: hypothetical protein LBE36_01780, partial [Flavobacteriaceae bacterium]|nr:hypothetical protein [Flavobacteriaceae bacterium]
TIRLYIRPEFESSFQELTAKGEIKLRHTTPEGWDFVSVGGFAGYTPTEKLLKEKETEQEAEKERKKKYSFVVEDEDDIQPEKKKGFWDGLFG